MVENWIWVLIPVAGILCGMVAIYTEHRQKMAMIEKGIKPEELHRAGMHKPQDILVGGLVVTGIGLAFLVTEILGGLSKWLLLPGFILLFIGIALTVSYYLAKKSEKEQ